MLELLILQLLMLNVSYMFGPNVRKVLKNSTESAAADEYVAFCVALYRNEDRLVNLVSIFPTSESM
jgi:hypothetical protein